MMAAAARGGGGRKHRQFWVQLDPVQVLALRRKALEETERTGRLATWGDVLRQLVAKEVGR